MSEDQRGVTTIWSHSFVDKEPKSYNAALAKNPNGIAVFGGGLEFVALVRWKIPTLVQLCRATLEEDPEKDQWPAEVAELVREN